MEVDKDCWTGRCRRALKGGYEILEAPLPRVVSVKTACNEPRFMGYRLKPGAFEKDRVTMWNAADLEAAPDCIGLPGSPTIVTELGTAPVRERKREFLAGSPEGIAQRLITVIEQVV